MFAFFAFFFRVSFDNSCFNPEDFLWIILQQQLVSFPSRPIVFILFLSLNIMLEEKRSEKWCECLNEREGEWQNVRESYEV